MEIYFPGGSVYDPATTSVVFPVKIGGALHRCFISEEALQDHFDGTGADLVAAFEAHRYAIEPVASAKIMKGARVNIQLKTSDF